MEAKIISQDTFLNYVQKSSVARDIGPLFLSRSNMVLNMNLGLRICIQKNFHPLDIFHFDGKCDEKCDGHFSV